MLSKCVDEMIVCFIAMMAYNDISDHRIGEIVRCLNRTYKRKFTKRFLRKKEIYDCLTFWADDFDREFEYYVNEAKAKEKRDFVYDLTKDEVRNFVLKYLDWLAGKLSKFGIADYDEAKEEIKKIIQGWH